MVGPWKVHHFEGEDLQAEVGSVTEHDGRVDLPERVCLRPWDHTVEGRAHWAELRPGDAYGIEGVDIENIEAAASVHQHLGEALLADDGVDDERVVTWSGDVGRMISLIKSDRGIQPAKERGDGQLGGACLSIAYLVLTLGVDSVGSPKD